MTLFDDPRVIEAAIHEYDAARRMGKGQHEALTSALKWAPAALPREELIEKAAQAIAAADGARNFDQRPVRNREYAEAVLMAIGLIPEHVTATEER